MKRKSTCILGIGIIGIIIFFLFFYKIDCCIEKAFCCKAFILEQKLSSFCCNIMDAFYVIWGMTLTLVLFVLEFGNSYVYGITLKKILKFSLNTYVLIVGAIEYLLLCPVVYYFHSTGKELACIWGNICVFVTFCIIASYIFYKTRPLQILKLLTKKTEEQVIQTVKKSRTRQVEDALQKHIENFAITDMIKHINYNNVKEVSMLIDAIAEIIGKIMQERKGTEYEHLVLMIWISNIIETSGLGTEHEKKQTEYVLMNLFDKIIANGEVTEEMISYTVQILCPLIERGTDDAAEVFYSLWKKVNFFQKHIIWYLCLYEEYLYFKNEERSEEHHISLELVGQDRTKLPMCVALWDKEKAWEFWRSWITMRTQGNNLAMSVFFAFCNDVEMMKKGKYSNMNSRMMRRYYWKTR